MIWHPGWTMTAALCGAFLAFAAAAQNMSGEDLLKEIESSADAERGRVGASRGARIYEGEVEASSAMKRKNPKTVDTSGVKTLTIPRSRDPINLPILFDFDSAFLKPESQPQLKELCAALRRAKSEISFMIIGHSDASGGATYNELLSMLRAEEVVRWLVVDCGVAATRLVAIGLGESDPLPAHSPNAAAQRRVEVLVAS